MYVSVVFVARAGEKSKINSSSTAEYFAKNLQQVGFSSPLKAVLTTLKESVDNALDACEEANILPRIMVEVKKIGPGTTRKTDLVQIVVQDNGPGLLAKELPKVFGEYLASSKFGRGKCSRGQQGIGISAATTWAQLTSGSGVEVISKTKNMPKAIKAIVGVDIKKNQGSLTAQKSLSRAAFPFDHGLRLSFNIDGRVQLNGDGGLITYLEGTALVNPHLELEYHLLDHPAQHIKPVLSTVPRVPEATLPHPHTLKLGEFMAHGALYGKVSVKKFLSTGFSRVSEKSIKDFRVNGLKATVLKKALSSLSTAEYREMFAAVQKTALSSPSTSSVMVVGEEALAKSIQRLGETDFFSVNTRKPKVCDFKPVVVEVAIARFTSKTKEEEQQAQLLRFANRVPLQFDKAACAITKAVESVNWRAYGLQQSKNSVPMGPYVFAVSVTSPFIKFKNASKETIDASDELIDELRLSLMQAGQKLARHIRREHKAAELERKKQHIEKFGPILVEALAKMSGASKSVEQRASEGLLKILGRDSKEAEEALSDAAQKLAKMQSSKLQSGEREQPAPKTQNEQRI